MALRFGMGASRARVVGQVLIENIVLALLGGAVGVALAAIGRPVVIALAGASVPQLEYLTMDGRVLTFGLVITMITGIALGVVPALQASMVDVNELLKQSGRSTTISRGGRAFTEQDGTEDESDYCASGPRDVLGPDASAQERREIVVPVPLERQEAIREPQIYVLISVHGSPFLQRAQTTKAAQVYILVHPCHIGLE